MSEKDLCGDECATGKFTVIKLEPGEHKGPEKHKDICQNCHNPGHLQTLVRRAVQVIDAILRKPEEVRQEEFNDPQVAAFAIEDLGRRQYDQSVRLWKDLQNVLELFGFQNTETYNLLKKREAEARERRKAED